jgi:glycosyltransferase involved in cell wall biosynthesis
MAIDRTVALLASFPESLINFRGPLIELLRARGYSVIACAPNAPPQLLDKLAMLGVAFHPADVERNEISVWRDFLYACRVYAWLRRARPQCLLAYTAKPVIYGLIAARLAGIKGRCALITGLGYALTGESLKRRLLSWTVGRLYRMALRDCRCVMFQNPDDLSLFKARRMLPPDARTIVVNGSGVDLRQFAPRRLPGEPIFLLIARLLRDKGIREYADAARVVKSRFREARFQLAGWTDTNPTAIDKAELERWVAEGVIEYLGPLDDVRTALAAARIYVLPSYREGTPRTVLEAMATGRPVITTDAPGCRETVQHEINGLLVPVGDVPQLAAAMIRMIENPELAEAYGRAGLRIARERYDAHVVSEATAAAMGL